MLLTRPNNAMFVEIGHNYQMENHYPSKMALHDFNAALASIDIRTYVGQMSATL